MKAYKVTDVHGDGYCTVVFAETRGKARSIAMGTDCCEDTEFINIRATRIPELDEEYRGYSEMSWYDTQDRIALVKAGFYCSLEFLYETNFKECDYCPARDYCDAYTDYYKDFVFRKCAPQ